MSACSLSVYREKDLGSRHTHTDTQIYTQEETHGRMNHAERALDLVPRVGHLTHDLRSHPAEGAALGHELGRVVLH